MNRVVSQLGYLGLEVRDVDRWERFATEILGLEAHREAGDDGSLLRVDGNHHRIALREGARDDVAYVGWQLPDEGALEAVAARLRSQGAEVAWGTADRARARAVTALFEVRDPSGVSNEVFTGPRMGAPLCSPRGLRGFEAGELGFGHVVLCVDDLETSLRFYCDGLGLRVSDYIDMDMGSSGVVPIAFLHAGPRHHSLALVPVDAPKRLHHFMLQTKAIQDVGSTLDLCRERGVPISSDLGQHTNDRMVSFYMESPSGFQVELGWGGVLVDDVTWQVQRYDAPSLWGHHPPGAG